MKRKKKQTKASYQRKRAEAAAVSRAKSLVGRDIGKLPPVKDPERRKRARESFEFFCRTYLGETFSLPWSADHRKVIEKIETASKLKKKFAFAMPRGSGKTSLSEAAALWDTLNGFCSFVFIISSEAGAAAEILASIKSELSNNKKLIEDFPEVCYPIAQLEGIAHRCNGQLYNGQRTYIRWTNDEIVLPRIAGSAASSAIIGVAGLTASIRGKKFKRPDGKTARPDFILLDDPQTDESARSPSQTEMRLRLIRSAVLGLAGPGKEISAVMPCTVICPGDLADELLSREKHPEWNGERSKLLNSLPANIEMWERYRQLRSDSLRAGNQGREANEFYAANREEMDRGGAAAWSERKNADEVSAIQHGMNLKFDLGDEAFASEYQNDPLPLVKLEDDALTPDGVASKLSAWPRAMVPLQSQRLTAFVDIQKHVLFWLVLATGEGFDGWIVDYGAFPDQRREYFTLGDVRNTLGRHTGLQSEEAWIRAGLDQLTASLLNQEWKRPDGGVSKIEQMLIDSAWGDHAELVYEFCRACKFSAIVKPSRGEGHGAKSRPFEDYVRKAGDKIGLNWRIPANQKQRASRVVFYETNWWKSFVAKRLKAPIGAGGCYTLFGKDPKAHRMFADHVCVEVPHLVTAESGKEKRSVTEWIVPEHRKMQKADNHWWDCLVGATVAAAIQGASLSGKIQGEYKKRRHVDFTKAA